MSNPYPDHSQGVFTTPNYNVPLSIPKNQIEFRQSDTTWVMRITADRRIEVNEDVEVTEAAKKVLDAMQHLLTPQRTWVGLTGKDYNEIFKKARSGEHAVQLAEAKLKELNT